ncbi:MAG: hypothetical protein PHI32_05410 [Dysgonamonadaceae bacterium]|nr:hypothetical protein [Dysgonamonadaceae bacterium]MDD4728297.1 hypothetical protein [Dysgonamonadaceae bacterium]
MEVTLRFLPNDYKLKKNYLDSNSNNIETLVLGSSHAYYGISPKYLSPKSFNAGYVSQSIDFDYEIINKYRDNFKNLKTVVLPISYFTFFTTLETNMESWRIKNYVIYYDINKPHHLSDYSELLSNDFKINVFRLGGYYIKRKIHVYSDEFGWGTDHNSKNAVSLIETGESAALRNTFDVRLEATKRTFEENVKLLYSIAEWCKINKIKLILLTPPAYQTYIDNLDDHQLSMTVKTANAVASKYENCQYYNLINDSSFTAIDFYDADHLSENGAKKLSDIISKKINGLK